MHATVRHSLSRAGALGSKKAERTEDAVERPGRRHGDLPRHFTW
jgi:hypothetical protein